MLAFRITGMLRPKEITKYISLFTKRLQLQGSPTAFVTTEMASVRFLTRMSLPRLISVTPSTALVDTKVTIKATGVEANSHVTIRSECEQDTPRGRVRVEGHAHYIADDRGVVSVPDQTSWGGTYTGTEPMGLFWSMQPSPGQKPGVRYMVKDVTEPMVVDLSLYHGHLDTDTLQTAEPEASTTAERWYLGKDVERSKVHSGRLRGSLFKPKGAGPFPGVIDMFGNAGGLIEIRAAMLASRGFACYCLAYFKYEDLPSTAWELDLEYFKEAIDWLSDQPFVKPGGIGLAGVSAGGQYAQAMAAHFPEKLRAVVSINGCHVQSMFPFKLNGKVFPFIGFDTDAFQPSMSRTIDGFKVIHDVKDDDAVIFKLENAKNCQFLFIAGEGETIWDSCHYARESTRRLARHGCHNYQLLTYPNAGHLIEIPYAPCNNNVFSPMIGQVLEHGGTVLGNAKAMEDSWPKMVRFLHAHCGRGNSKL